MKKIIALAALSITACVPARFAAAQAAYPNKPIRLIVTFAPAGSVDIIARVIAPKLSEKLGQSVVVENRAGASGIIGIEAVKNAAPDGYTLMLNTIPFVANQYMYKKLPYSPLNDFVPISLVVASPSVLVVNPKKMPVNSVKELIEVAKSKPGQLDYSAAGAGTNPHISGELFNKLAGVKLQAIQYKGGGPAVAAVVSGEVGIMFSNVSESAAFVKSGQLRALGVTSSVRSPVYPDLPTVAEAGVPGYEFSTWHGMLAPKGTPDAIVQLLSQKVQETARDPEISKRLQEMGLDVIASTPQQFGEHLKKESAKWGQVLKDGAITLD
ncbi:tripartite tricarboxylate transporter substrate binding protein [Pigmentiphaga soli]|uniref:Tripartite tricarboxylate transporter substrate binding protein n=1 Tax=Pigmentiphaga soli TaxID=1007095 RepID=A0ABP8HMS9_9BURK